MMSELKMTNEEFAHSLFHEYDPVKRKEYYERTKKLKGRKKGLSETTSGSDRGSAGNRRVGWIFRGWIVKQCKGADCSGTEK